MGQVSVLVPALTTGWLPRVSALISAWRSARASWTPSPAPAAGCPVSIARSLPPRASWARGMKPRRASNAARPA